jgi:AcrR family transcriptional regulator
VTSTSVDSQAGPRSPGRPRDPAVEQAIIDATLQLLADEGFGLSIEAVAARAGVGKATIYRRWPNKDQLIVDALAQLQEPVEHPPGGSVRDELVAILDAVRRKATTSLAGKILPRLMAEATSNPALLQAYRRQVLEPRRQLVADALRRGMDSGNLRTDLDIEHVIDLLVGPVMYRLVMRPSDRPVPRNLPARVVDDVLAGLAVR